MQSIRLRLLALFAVLLVALPLAAAARELYQCRMMGRVMSSCCCASSAQTAHAADRGPSLEKSDCCTRLEQRTQAASGVRDEAARSAAAPLATQTRVCVILPEPVQDLRVREPAHARAPPPTGPPLFLKHCALLS